MSLQPASMMTPLAQQMSHLSLGSAGTVRRPLLVPKRDARFRITSLEGDSASLHFYVQFMAASTPMQGAYIPQYAHIQPSAVPVEVKHVFVLRVKSKSTFWEDKQLLKKIIHIFFFFLSRKIVRRLKWIHPAIIPHIPTNKPSSVR